MMNWWRTTRLFVGTAIGALLATAASTETLTVYWNAGHAYQAYSDVITKFEADHPGWSVRWEKFQWPDMRTKLVADFAAKNPPDLVAEPGGWVQEFGQQGLLRPLNDFIAQGRRGDGLSRGLAGLRRRAEQARRPVLRRPDPSDLRDPRLQCRHAEGSGFRRAACDMGGVLERSPRRRTTGARFGFAPNPSIGYYWSWFLQNGVSYYDPETNKVNLDTPRGNRGDPVPFRPDPQGKGCDKARRGRGLRGAAKALHGQSSRHDHHRAVGREADHARATRSSIGRSRRH